LVSLFIDKSYERGQGSIQKVFFLNISFKELQLTAKKNLDDGCIDEIDAYLEIKIVANRQNKKSVFISFRKINNAL